VIPPYSEYGHRHILGEHGKKRSPMQTVLCLNFYTTWNGDYAIHLNFGGHNHKLRLSSSVIGGEMPCRRNVHIVGEVSSYRFEALLQ